MLKASRCFAVAFATAMAMSLVTYFAYWPPRWKHLDPGYLADVALLGALYTALVPGMVLCWIAVRRTPSALLSVFTATSWLFLAFLCRARKPWMHYDEFPWWMFDRDFVEFLPISFSAGLAFAICARKLERLRA